MFNSHSSSPIAVQLPRADSAFRAAPGSQAAALKISGAPRRRGRGPCCDAVTMCRTPLANPVIYTCKRCDDESARPLRGADDARKQACTPDPHWLLAARMLPKWRSWSASGASRVRDSVYDFSTFAFPYGPVDIDTALGALFRAGACGAGVSVGSQWVYRRPRSRYTWQ